MTEDQVKEAMSGSGISKKRVLKIINIAKEDNVAIELIKEVVESVFRYITMVGETECAIKVSYFRLEGKRLREVVSRYDNGRKISHDSLITSVLVLNRYLFKTYSSEIIPVGGIYSDDPMTLTVLSRDSEDRTARRVLGDWAISLACDYVKNRR